ncbi:methyltransferase domain-containing protein [Ruegeria sp. HKCCD6157]|uniref:methyltransferase domain-containing protein n=1 Tax=Ruegeria sp. HKCCD6157 TaxID=2690707 RepID=UPI0014912A2B|nr:methyltransferase domain-containing protein [Ruegeria sp. HKCCD6157]NOE25240.1 methyltransferase domain-containing protein [Ruegeria sp. HKCCD6157]
MPDIYQSLDQQGEDTVRVVADRLEFRGEMPDFVKMRERYFDRLDWASCRRIVDLGCGTGVVTRALADRVGPECDIVGSDLAAELIKVAMEKTDAAGLAGRIRYEVADSRNTGDGQGSFDIVIAHTVISHVADPAAMLEEAARLTRPGGTIAIFDGDYASLTIGAGDPDANAMAVDAILQTVVGNPFVLRHLPFLARQTGLEVAGFIPELLAEAGQTSFFGNMIDAYVGPCIQAGAIDAETALKWAEGQKAAAREGTFFGSCNYYTYLLRKPE